MKVTRFLSAVAIFAGATVARAEGEAAASITGGEIREHAGFLANDALEGRDTGSAGERTAGDYLVERLRGYGLEPAGEDGTFFQRFDVPNGARPSATSRLVIERQGFSRDFALGEDAQPFGFSAQGTVSAPLVFAGYGITDPAPGGRDDYAGLDVKGKVVLVLRHEPGLAVGRSRLAHFITKAENAKAHGAVALLVVTGPLHHPADDELVGTQPGQGAGIVAFHVRQSLVKGLFKLAGRDLVEVQRENEKAPVGFDLGATASTTLQLETETLHARNVIARLPGTDLAHEVVVVGAHYDHVGHGDFGSLGGDSGAIHNGADDNASGTSGMLELAQAFSQGRRPRRTILFMGFSGEERGLLGSEHWVKNPTVPLASVVAMINLDMIGRLRNDTLEVGGIGTAAGFKTLVEGALAAEGLKGTLTPSGMGPSDHASFCAGKVPVLFFFTGEHEDYHRPSDDIEKLETNGAARVARAAFRCVEALAGEDARPVYVQVQEARGGRGGDPNRPRLGVMLDRARTEGGAGIQSVVANGPAARAGLRDGDVIVQVGEVTVNGQRDLMEALGTKKIGDKVKVTALRGEERVTVEVELAGQ